MEDTKTLQATKAFETFCKMLDGREWRYDSDPEELTIHTKVRGDDFPINLRIQVDAKRMLVRLQSPLVFEVATERIPDMALAVCAVNDNLADGTFDLDVEDGDICYRMSLSFRESLISEEALDYFLGFSIHVVDSYSIKFFMVAKEMLTPWQLLEEMKND